MKVSLNWILLVLLAAGCRTQGKGVLYMRLNDCCAHVKRLCITNTFVTSWNHIDSAGQDCDAGDTSVVCLGTANEDTCLARACCWLGDDVGCYASPG